MSVCNLQEVSAMFAPTDDDNEPMMELPATLSQAWFNDVIDADAVDLLHEVLESEPICPSDDEPFVPSALDVLEGRAHQVADTYDFIEYPLSVAVVNPERPNDPYRISRVAGMPVCSCKAFKHSKENVCKHILALSVLEIEIPEPLTPEVVGTKPCGIQRGDYFNHAGRLSKVLQVQEEYGYAEVEDFEGFRSTPSIRYVMENRCEAPAPAIEPVKAWDPNWVRPAEVLPSAETLARMGWDGDAW